jgi:hypothetical protein
MWWQTNAGNIQGQILLQPATVQIDEVDIPAFKPLLHAATQRMWLASQGNPAEQ